MDSALENLVHFKKSAKLQCNLLGSDKNYVLIAKFTSNFNCTRVAHRNFTDTWIESEVETAKNNQIIRNIMKNIFRI